MAERFRVEELLASSASVDVYRARHLELDREVALKVLRSGVAPAVLEQFRAEALALSGIRHPHVLQLTDLCTAGTTNFMVLEFLPGRTLESILRDESPPPAAFAARVMDQLLSALAAVHEVNLVHRDVTPGNCVCVNFSSVFSPPEVRLIDFGLCEPATAETPATLTSHGTAGASDGSPGASHGTSGYAAPKTVGSADPREDIYAAGAIAYELWTGMSPFGVDEPLDVERRQRDSRLVPARDAAGAGVVSPEVSDAIGRALEPDPDRRYQSASEFGDALSQALAVAPSRLVSESVARVASSRERIGAPRDRDPLLDGLLETVREIWIEGVLKSHRATLTSVPQRKTLVRRPLGSEAGSEGRADGRDLAEELELEESAPIGPIMKDLDGPLVILGEPGHGKTLTLLRLLRVACDDAMGPKRESESVPVLFNLSSWRPDRGSMLDWMVGELAVQYLVPREQGRKWLEDAWINPYLDGLNEVPPGTVAECVEALNVFQREVAPDSLVATCRLKEYAASPIKVNAGAVVSLHPLQLSSVLQHTRDERWTPLHRALAESPRLGDLLGVPFLLQIACELGTEDSALAEAARTRLDPSRRVLGAYVRRVSRRSSKSPAEQARIGRVVGQLARGLQHAGRTIFMFEEIQPEWLTRASTRWIYALSTRLIVAAVFGLTVAAPVALTPLENAGLAMSVEFGLLLGGLGALVLGAGHALRDLMSTREVAWGAGNPKSRTIASDLTFSMCLGAVIGSILYQSYPNGIVLFMGVEVAVVGGIILGTSRRTRRLPAADIALVEIAYWRPSRIRPIHLFLLLGGGLFAGIVQVLFEDLEASLHLFFLIVIVGVLILGHERGRRPGTPAPNVGIHRSLRYALRVGTLTFLVVGLLFSASYGLAYGAWVGLCAGSVAGLSFGGVDVLNHYLLRLLLAWDGHLDLRAHAWLARASEAGMLRRVGGGYMFEHSMLLEHFAEQADA